VGTVNTINQLRHTYTQAHAHTCAHTHRHTEPLAACTTEPLHIQPHTSFNSICTEKEEGRGGGKRRERKVNEGLGGRAKENFETGLIKVEEALIDLKLFRVWLREDKRRYTRQ
jgi:hypothetical protein